MCEGFFFAHEVDDAENEDRDREALGVVGLVAPVGILAAHEGGEEGGGRESRRLRALWTADSPQVKSTTRMRTFSRSESQVKSSLSMKRRKYRAQPTDIFQFHEGQASSPVTPPHRPPLRLIS